MVEAMRKAHKVKQFFRTSRRSSLMLANVEGNFDILLRGQGRNQVESLENHAYFVVTDSG